MHSVSSSASSAASAPTVVHPPLAWELIFDGVWIARRHGAFAGTIQSLGPTSFKLTDEHGNMMGQFTSVYDARNALISHW